MSKSTAQKFELTTNGQSFKFEIDRPQYNKYVNSVNPKNKVAPHHNLLVDTVFEEDKEALVAFLKKTPGGEIALADQLLDNYTPDLGVEVKKL